MPVAHAQVAAIFSQTIDHWVVNHQGKTSAFTKALLSTNAALAKKRGDDFTAALGLASARDQGVQHPSATTAVVQIPASATSYGGEMTVSAKADGVCTKLTIDGRTQGLFGGSLQEHVSGLQAFLTDALPAAAAERTDRPAASTGMADELEKLAKLHAAGVLSDAEFGEAKKKLLR